MSEDTAVVNPEVSIDVAEKVAKPRMDALLLADYGSITQSGKADLGGIFDRFLVDPDKKTTGLFYLYIRVVNTTIGQISISFYDPDGRSMGDAVVGLVDEDQGKNGITFLQRIALEVPKEGRYWIEVSYQGQSLGGSSFGADYIKKEIADGSINA